MSDAANREASLADRLSVPGLFQFGLLAGQLAVLLWVIDWYSLEGVVFKKLAILLWAGFAVHYFLPDRWSLPFFGLLSAAGLLVIFGPAHGAALLGLGLAAIGLCHLPISIRARVLLLIAAAVLLCFMRAGRIPTPWLTSIWPVFGSMFALRMILYVHELRHRSAPFSFWHSIGYFFMLPNSCFPLFPVVDYQTFCRSQAAAKDRPRVFQTGIDWMVRGTVHLVLYRLIYQNLPIDASSVTDPAQLLRYLFWPFLLYLHVSGLFHLVVGMLHLFGFDLPETHRLFYLASSFTDFWRRINIYWKDFMMKVFYYPAYFRLRRWGPSRALVVCTFIVFFGTWFLHSWQWFWLRGSFLLKGSDVLFWSILSLLVAINVVLESRRPARRRLRGDVPPWGESVRKALQALGVFVTICLLWSLWVSDTVPGWLSLFDVLGDVTGEDLWLVPVVLGTALIFVLVALAYQRRPARPFGFYRHVLQSGAVLFLLLLVGWPDVRDHLDEDTATVVANLRRPGLNSRDAARRQRDYYEKLNDVGWDNPELAKVYGVRPADWGSIRYRPDLARFHDGLPYLELIPFAEGRHRGAVVRFNRWGIRDLDYPPAPEEGVFRIALVGASHSFGSGVPPEEDFESLVEDRLNRDGGLGDYPRVEILNFSTEGYSALDVLAATEQKVLGFRPRALLYVVHQLDAHFAVARLAQLLADESDIPYPALRDFAAQAGVAPGTVEDIASRALEPAREALLAWAYQQLADRCRSQGVIPVMAYLPILTPHHYDLPVATLLRIGRDAGFLTLDLSGVYDGHDTAALQIAIWDDHPNVTGHRLVADRLYEQLRGVEASLRNDAAGPGEGLRSGTPGGGAPSRTTQDPVGAATVPAGGRPASR